MHGAAVLATAIASFGLVAPTTALAQPASRLDEVEAFLGDADFDGAQAALAELAAGDGLSRQDVLRWLELSAVLEFAVSGGETPTRQLEGLVSLAPDYELSPSRPPELRIALTATRSATRGALTQRIDVEAEGANVSFRAWVQNDPAALVRESRIFARAPNGAAWRESSSGRLRVDSEGSAVQYYATAYGPGGAILSEAGSEAAPLTTVGASHNEADHGPLGELAEHDDETDTALWVGLGIAGAVVVAALAILVVVVVTSTPDSVLTQPMFELAAP